MSEPDQRNPTYGPPPAAAYGQPSGPPAPVPPGAAYPAQPVPPGYPPVPPGYPPVPPGYPPATQGYPPAAPLAPEPQVFAAPYAAPAPGTYPAPASTPHGSTLGVVALILAIVALVVTPIIAAIAGYNIGTGVGHEIAARPSSADFDLRLLSPVRGSVLVGEIAFWAGTVLGIWALVQGIVAIVKNRGRGPAIAAVIIAVLGPIAFGVAVNISVVAGLGAGAAPFV
ncbi:hypothetical protein [uncultured Microbacterium sp.]|uniref:hypothetical protein n=1 Tax=uncultured Microbacterium sp. TaxID=191216 RepID=UPI0035CB978F